MSNTINLNILKNQIFSIKNEIDFEDAVMSVFYYQSSNNTTYKDYMTLLDIDSQQVKAVNDIPFLPIEFFKEKRIVSGSQNHEMVFESSGTTGISVSRHFVTERSVYDESFLKCFEFFYGSPSGYAFLALLPSYIERKNSSLVYMMNRLITESQNPFSGFYLDDLDE